MTTDQAIAKVREQMIRAVVRAIEDAYEGRFTWDGVAMATSGENAFVVTVRPVGWREETVCGECQEALPSPLLGAPNSLIDNIINLPEGWRLFIEREANGRYLRLYAPDEEGHPLLEVSYMCYDLDLY